MCLGIVIRRNRRCRATRRFGCWRGRWPMRGERRRPLLVFSGHFHKKSDDGQIYYLGNTYEITWADYKCPRGFHVFDTETRELDRIVNPHTIFNKVYYDDRNYNYSNFVFVLLHFRVSCVLSICSLFLVFRFSLLICFFVCYF